MALATRWILGCIVLTTVSPIVQAHSVQIAGRPVYYSFPSEPVDLTDQLAAWRNAARAKQGILTALNDNGHVTLVYQTNVAPANAYAALQVLRLGQPK